MLSVLLDHHNNHFIPSRYAALSLLNSLTCSRVAPVSTLVLLVEVGRVVAFGAVGVLLPFGFGVVGFVFGGFFGVFGVLISMLPILICAEAPIAKTSVTKHN